MVSRLISAALLSCAPLYAQSAKVWVIDDDGGPGVHFMNLHEATAAASDGDILLVKSGVYTPFVNFFEFHPIDVDGKGMSIFAEPGAILSGYSPSGIKFKNLTTAQRMVVRGFKLQDSGLAAGNIAGGLWLEELAVDPVSGVGSLDVAICAQAMINRCALRGASPFDWISTTPAISANMSSLHAFDCALEGGSGYLSFASKSAGSLTDSFAFLSGSSLQQGMGGFPAPVTAGLQTGASSASVLRSTSGDWSLEGGTQTVLPGVARSFRASAIQREGEQVTFTWSGPVGEYAILNLSANPSALYLAPYLGSSNIGLPLLLVAGAGTIPGTQTIEMSIPVPTFPPGFEGIVLFAQGSFANLTNGAIRIGGGSAFLLLDAAL